MVAKNQLAGGNLPDIAAAVAVDPVGFAVVASGEADVFVNGFKEPDVPQTQGFVLLAQLAQPFEMVQEILVRFPPGVGAAIEEIGRASCRERV